MKKYFKYFFVILCVIGIYLISKECVTEFGFKAVVSQEDTSYPFFTNNKLNPNEFPPYDNRKELKIPAISHHVWVTSPKKPREINELDLEHVMNSIKIMDAGNLKWRHILWTNDENLIPATSQSLKEIGVEIKNISELGDALLKEDIAKMIKKSSFSEASDLIRYMALQEYGGIYNDTDIELFKNIDNLMQQFDFIGAEHKYYYYEPDEEEFDTIGSAFLAAKKSHPVVNSTLKLITRNLHSVNLPKYIKNACSSHNNIWVTTGPMALTIAFFREGNNKEDKNIIFKMEYFYNRCEKNREDHISCHDLNGDWYGRAVKK